MPMWELSTWTEYVQENGPLNASLRMEAAIARAVIPFLKKAKFRDFMPWPRERVGGPQVDQMKTELKALFVTETARTKASKRKR